MAVVTNRTVNYETGEVKSETFRLATSEPPYVKLYLDTLATILDYQKSYNPVLLQLLKNMSYADPTAFLGGQLISTSLVMKQDVAKKCGVTVNRVNQVITGAKKAGLLISVGRGMVQANPEYFGRGNWADIRNIREIRANMVFNEKGVSIETETVENKPVEEDSDGKPRVA